MVKFYVKSNGVAVIKTMNGKGFLKGDQKFFESLKERSTPKASRLIAKVLREIRRVKNPIKKENWNFDECREFYKFAQMDSEQLKIECYGNFAAVGNRTKKIPCKNLFDYNQSISIKGIVD